MTTLLFIESGLSPLVIFGTTLGIFTLAFILSVVTSPKTKKSNRN